MTRFCDEAILRISAIVESAAAARRLKKEILERNQWARHQLEDIRKAIAKTRECYPNADTQVFAQKVNQQLGYKLSESAIFQVARYDALQQHELTLRRDFFKHHTWTVEEFRMVRSAVENIRRCLPAARPEFFCQQVRREVESLLVGF